MGKELTIIAEAVREYVPPYGAYSKANARHSRLTEAVMARKAYQHIDRVEPCALDMRA
jgi:hypothetical protein